MRTKEVEEHIPRTQKPSLVDASEKNGQVLVEQDEIAIAWSFLKNLEECVNIFRGEVAGAGHWDELRNHPCQDAEHWPKWGFDE